MKFHDFSPFYRSSEGIKPKVSGDRLLDNPLVADLQSGASFKFSPDGTGDVVSTSSEASFDVPVVTMTAWIKKNAGTQTMGILNKEDSYRFALQSNKLLAAIGSTGKGWAWVAADTLVMNDNEWTHVAFSYDGSVCRYYVNGVAGNTDSSFSGDLLNSSYNFEIGRLGGNAHPFDGEIRQARLHNRALSADEVRASYSGQAVSYEYRGASQTNLLTGNASNFASGAGWTAVSSTLDTSGTNTLKIDVTADGAGVYNTGLLTEGLRYRMTMQVSAMTQNWELRAWDGGSQLTLASISTGLNQLEFVVPKGSNGSFYIYSAQTGTSSITIDASSTVMKLVRIGCVAEYLPTGISATKWIDTSGNGLNGSTSTATAVNHKIGSLTLASLSADSVSFSSDDNSSLSYYEEGYFTPVLTSTGATLTHDAQQGKYTRIGNLVYFSILVGTDAASGGTASNAVTITGLPFTASNNTIPTSMTGNVSAGAAPNYSGPTGVGYAWTNAPYAWIIDNNTATINLYKTSGSTTTYQDMGTGANDNRLYITGTYITE